jgi:hypothetical protein
VNPARHGPDQTRIMKSQTQFQNRANLRKSSRIPLLES